MPFPKPVMDALDGATPVQKALCGANVSLLRGDALRVNGFDETIRYGGGDKEFGVRLINAGVAGRHLRYTAPLVHLDHPRGYNKPEKIARHKARIAKCAESGRSGPRTAFSRGRTTSEASLGQRATEARVEAAGARSDHGDLGSRQPAAPLAGVGG